MNDLEQMQVLFGIQQQKVVSKPEVAICLAQLLQEPVRIMHIGEQVGDVVVVRFVVRSMPDPVLPVPLNRQRPLFGRIYRQLAAHMAAGEYLWYQAGNSDVHRDWYGRGVRLVRQAACLLRNSHAEQKFFLYTALTHVSQYE